jgi:hypothetical protein
MKRLNYSLGISGVKESLGYQGLLVWLNPIAYLFLSPARRTVSPLGTREIDVEDISDGEDHYGD